MRVRVADFGAIARLPKKVDNLKHVVGLVHRMLKSKKLRVPIEDIEILSCLRELR